LIFVKVISHLLFIPKQNGQQANQNNNNNNQTNNQNNKTTNNVSSTITTIDAVKIFVLVCYYYSLT
jgi:hypothetical protein